ncbi:LytS/YhcK type 5TM receptor domain-containing protein [Dongshaea marina]|uniref:LytS/YhcK type 5TM receptor domain-containing protein n=1 Tax=Dongshaea marina TaxID=2047966 RepID=UPI000D3ED74F|nr:LytS/YhcK type 5TM receptor domain-containing protein [Dongshaea marina]
MYQEQLMMLLGVLERAALLFMVLFLLTRTTLFQQLFKKREFKPTELALISGLFILFAVFSTYTGIRVAGSLVNVRIIAILSGGILFGPWVGIPAGLISGVHRYIIDVGGVTSIPCLISSIVAGLLGTWIHLRCKKNQYWIYGMLSAMTCEILTMLLIVALSPQSGPGIVKLIAFPMIAGTACIGLIIKLIQGLDDEMELIAARQAKLALNIANQTLPYFRENHPDSLKRVCQIIRDDIGADAVAITDTQEVRAYVGVGEQAHSSDKLWEISPITRQAVQSRQLILSNDLTDNLFRSLLIIPLTENEQISGTLKIYYRKKHKITQSLQEMAIGLSHLISTQLEVSRIEQLKSMASKAEFSALQSKINPHFLFNALNAISSLIRIRPDDARALIAHLADFLRFNLERGQEMIDLQEELKQVRDYISIEQARFGKKLKVEFDVDPVDCQIPSLLIQPLVENAIQHGIQPNRGPGVVTIIVKQLSDRIKITIRDSGRGISHRVIERLRLGKMPSQSIGLMNVDQRVLLTYGHRLEIKRLEPGTEICFYIQEHPEKK